MKILALETATDACSVALHVDGETHQRFQIAPQRHTELLLPMVRELCAEAGVSLPALDAIAVGVGPGAFTGVRVATALAQGLAFAFEFPVLGVSTLAALALGGYRLSGTHHWLVVQDARRSEVYWAHYQIDPQHPQARLLTPEAVSAPSLVALPAAPEWEAAGSGWALYQEQADNKTRLPAGTALLWPEAQDLIPQAIHGIKAGQQLRPEALAPVYLRPAVDIKTP